MRGIDVREGTWVFAPGGYGAPVTLDFHDGAAAKDGIAYEMKEPVYADATGDGLEDALVPIESADGNGWQSLWYVFVARDGVAVQVTAPVARASRCGDEVRRVAADAAGFVIEQTLRMSPWDDAIPCSDPGTGVQRRVVAVHTDAAGLMWPIQREPLVAWGGLCPGSEWMDASPSAVALYVTPDTDQAPANPETTAVAVFPPRAEPWRVLPAGAADRAEEWAFVGFLSPTLPESEAVRLHCAWAAR